MVVPEAIYWINMLSNVTVLVELSPEHVIVKWIFCIKVYITKRPEQDIADVMGSVWEVEISLFHLRVYGNCTEILPPIGMGELFTKVTNKLDVVLTVLGSNEKVNELRTLGCRATVADVPVADVSTPIEAEKEAVVRAGDGFVMPDIYKITVWINEFEVIAWDMVIVLVPISTVVVTGATILLSMITYVHCYAPLKVY